MKFNLISFLVLTILTCSYLHAQPLTQKGRFLIGTGGLLNFSSLGTTYKNGAYSNNDEKTKSFQISEQWGYFILNNCALGLEVPYSYLKQKDEYEQNDYTYSMSSAGAVPYLRIYIGKSKAKLFMHGGIGPGWGNRKYFGDFKKIINTRIKATYKELGGGLSVFLKDNVSLDFGLGYISVVSKYHDIYNQSITSIRKGVSGSIDIVIYL